VAVEATEAGESRISHKEWRRVLGWSAVILLVTSLPYVYGTLISTPASQFGGFVIGVEDSNSYLAKMRLGAAGGWRFHLFYTSEPHDGAYLYLFHLLLGKIAQLSGLSFILVYHLARIVCGFFLLATVYRFAAFFTDRTPVRQLAFWLVGVGSGLGWLVTALGLLDRLGLPLDFYSPEAFAFHALFSLPHLSLAEGLLLWAILLLLIAWERHRPGYALLAGLALLGMTLIAAFYVLVAAAAIGAGWLLRWRQMGRGTGRRPWTEGSLAILALAMATPVPLYTAYVFATNPVFEVWGEQNRILSPSPVHYLLAFGSLALLAAIGGWGEWQRSSPRPVGQDDLARARVSASQVPAGRSLLLIGWCIVAPLLVYIPFNLQRRLALGVQVPLSILAALGLWRLLRAGDAPRRWRVVSVGMVTLLSLSNLLILAGAVLEVNRQSPLLFHSGTEINAADWLGTHITPDQVVLAAFETGNYLPTRLSARVFAGHGPETVNSDTKRAMLRQFFSSPDDGFRRRLLRDYGIDYVFYGPAERALGNFSPTDVSYLQQVYGNSAVQIYRVLLEDNP